MSHTEEHEEALQVRITSSLKASLDAEVERRQRIHPGQRVTRADVVRSLLWQALRATDA